MKTKLICTHCGRKQNIEITSSLNYLPCKFCKKEGELREVSQLKQFSTIKTISILLFALFLASCSKENIVPSGVYRLYNDRSNVTEMTVFDNSVSFSRNDSLLSVVEYSGDLLSDPFTMPANVWHNDNVSGSWSLRGEFLEFSYVAPNRDSSLIQYIPNETYIIDFYK